MTQQPNHAADALTDADAHALAAALSELEAKHAYHTAQEAGQAIESLASALRRTDPAPSGAARAGVVKAARLTQEAGQAAERARKAEAEAREHAEAAVALYSEHRTEELEGAWHRAHRCRESATMDADVAHAWWERCRNMLYTLDAAAHAAAGVRFRA